MPEAQHTPPPPPVLPSGSSADNDKLMAVLSYIGLLFIVPLLAVPKKSPFLLHHLRQGIVLFICSAILWVAGTMIYMWGIDWLLSMVIWVLSIVGIVKSLQNEMWELPVLGEYAKKINIK